MNVKYIVGLVLSLFIISCSNGQNASKQLSAKDFKAKIEQTENAVILDVRTPSEFQKGGIKSAVNIDWNDNNSEASLLKLDKQKTYFVYCLSGGRSASAADFLRSNGFPNVYELNGGILSWRAAGYDEPSSETTSGISMEAYQKMYANDKIVLIDFYADWCAPCKKMAPYLEELKKEYAGKVEIIRIDADQNAELCKQLNINGLPVVYIYKSGTKTFEHLGFISKEDLVKEL